MNKKLAIHNLATSSSFNELCTITTISNYSNAVAFFFSIYFFSYPFSFIYLFTIYLPPPPRERERKKEKKKDGKQEGKKPLAGTRAAGVGDRVGARDPGLYVHNNHYL